jgi:hypothetical protein
MRPLEGICARLRAGTVALALLTGVAVTPRVLVAQQVSSGAHVTREHVLEGRVGAVMSTGRPRLLAGAGQPDATASSDRAWTLVAELRTNAPAQPLLRATALRGAWSRRLADGTWAAWDGREVPMVGALGPGVHSVEVVLRGPADAQAPMLEVRAVPAAAAPGTPPGAPLPAPASAPPGAFGAPGR